MGAICSQENCDCIRCLSITRRSLCFGYRVFSANKDLIKQ